MAASPVSISVSETRWLSRDRLVKHFLIGPVGCDFSSFDDLYFQYGTLIQD